LDSLHLSCNHSSDIPVIWTAVLAICAIANVFIALFLWKTTHTYTTITKQIFLASQRPYIGISRYFHNIHPDTSIIKLSVELKNFGNTPAKNVDFMIEALIDDKILPLDNNTNKNQIFFPQSAHAMDAIFEDRNLLLAIIANRSTLKLHTHVTYKGITTQDYSIDEVSIYSDQIKNFITISGDWT
jgi:hypothetical protein